MQALSTRALVDRVARYVREYQTSMRFVLADEAYHQAAFDASGRQTAARLLTGEFFLAFVPGDGAWIAVHDVHAVDGTPVADRDDLRQLLRAGEVTPVARRVAERNARFNVGSVRRNFNEPTLPLLLFAGDRRDRVAFDRGGVTRTADGVLATITFRERGRPTLVMAERREGPGTVPAPAHGDIDVDADTGIVRRTRFALRDGDVEVELLTDYARDGRLDLWVPVTFRERYDALRDRRRELIVCDARYTNYRRFEVTGRIK
jgi:hypothetical protein